VGILCARRREADEGEILEAEISIQDREAAEPLLISLEGTSKGRIDSDVCSVPLE
jgi:hypothetical protein